MSHAIAAVAASVLFAALLPAQNEDPDAAPAGETSQSLEEMLAKYHPRAGTAKVGTVAVAKLAEGWVWLDRSHGQNFLVDSGNPRTPDVLGVAIPPDYTDSGVFAVYTYSDEGHVSDDEQPDWDALLNDMKASTPEQNKARKKAGLGDVTVLGWAEPPHYDKEQHKLYWAERLRFAGKEGEILNYNVRVLGRTGHLVVRGVGDIEQLDAVAEHSKALLEVTEFVDGHRYSDFNPAYDKVAAYGIGGLIAGKIALKVGLFAKLAILLKGLIKPLIGGVVLLGAFLVKVFRGKKKDEAQSPKPA